MYLKWHVSKLKMLTQRLRLFQPEEHSFPLKRKPPMTSSGPVFRALSVVGTCPPESDFSNSAVPVEALGSVRRLGRSQNLSCAD